MPIPDYQSLMLPLLRWFGDGQDKKLRDAVEAMSVEYDLTPPEREQLMSSGQTAIYNRVAWACTYLRKAVLLETTGRGIYRISERGRGVLGQKPERIDAAFLRRFEEFKEFTSPRQSSEDPSESSAASSAAPEARTPDEEIEAAYARLRSALELEVLDRVKIASPQFFERLVVELLVRMGYGGTMEDAGRAVGQSGDGGIDGVIKEDPLGLDVIYLQAKRWEGTVGRPEVHKFAGALQGQQATKGVFIKTSSYSREALEFAGKITTKMILIDGAQLASLMVDYNVGVTRTGLYELKRIDADYFEGG